MHSLFVCVYNILLVHLCQFRKLVLEPRLTPLALFAVAEADLWVCCLVVALDCSGDLDAAPRKLSRVRLRLVCRAHHQSRFKRAQSVGPVHL
jgi:hypothetical protein